jgi:hypothetical protein|nr:hypothetical protein [Clostridium sp. AF37-5AT]
MERSLQVQIKGKAPDGSEQVTIMEYIEVAREIEFTTSRMDAPGKLKFSCLEEGPIGIPEGSSVEYSVDGTKLFKGYVFTIERTRDGETSYTAYDQLRYLKANASYSFENMSLEQIITRIAGDSGLKVGKLEATGYVFPSLLKENEECLNIVFDALSETIIQTGKIFILYDKAGELTLVEAKNWFTSTMIGDNSLATDYTYKRDIDSDTYNRVKLVRKNEKSGRTDVYVHEDTDNIKKWGLLQYYDEVDEKLNEAQIDAMCKAYLEYYNRVLQTLKLEAIGIPELRAGMILPVKIGDIEDLAISRLLLAEKVTQKWEGENHTMQIEVKSFEQLGGVSIV